MNNLLIIVLRSIFLFFLTLVLTRVMGKRSLSNMLPFNFICYLVVAIIASLISLNIITNLFFGLIALAIWGLFPIALDYLSMKSKWIHDVVTGKQWVLMKNGKVMEENLSEVRLTGEELLRELRSKNVFNLADVEFAIMESTGEINICLKSDKKPVTAHDLGTKVSPKVEPQTIILDGNILNEGLTNMGLNQEWLKTQLENAGVALENVFIAQVDSSGEIYIDLFDDNIQVPQPKVKELLYANIEKVQSDLMSFALETQSENAKSMYLYHAKKLEEVMKKLKPYLLR
ncbi:hypothetical protein CPJCM30710_02800 [Clostridium polyendosporum]|uniref:YetF C-terminal domain-containing protein n=1 Tax=Clostridium polyendosporum TaxID=69208 RepID=A0A919VD49_9CLOT|nr:DUF421 domain-containing protein [Clostridium polyendosporum]GIM27614.1 hypothetical protein CPJCM30710_02800 [Clostridium polyendosporum]